jgi:hypothetical protein
MNPWGAFFEALHSVWIDEWLERYPDTTPELGLPQKVAGWSPPPSTEWSDFRTALNLQLTHTRPGQHQLNLALILESAENPILNDPQINSSLEARLAKQMETRKLPIKVEMTTVPGALGLHGFATQSSVKPRFVVWSAMKIHLAPARGEHRFWIGLCG